MNESYLNELVNEIEHEIQKMETVDELLLHMVKSELVKWNRIRDYLIMKNYVRYIKGETEHKNTQQFIVSMSDKFDCSCETVKNTIYGKESIIRNMVKN